MHLKKLLVLVSGAAAALLLTAATLPTPSTTTVSQNTSTGQLFSGNNTLVIGNNQTLQATGNGTIVATTANAVAVGNITGAGTGVTTALAAATNASGGVVTFGGNLIRGTPADNNYFLALAGPTGALSNTGSNVVAIGHRAAASLTNGSGIVAIGTFAGENNTEGDSVTLVGYRAGRNNTTGAGFTAMGDSAAASNIDGGNNSAFGDIASYSNENGSFISSFGYAALYGARGSYNNAFGASAGYNLLNGENNLAMGYAALYGGTGPNGASGNVGLGHSAGDRMKGYYNVLAGFQAGRNTNYDFNGNYHIGIGSNAAATIGGGTHSTFVGTDAGNNPSQKVDATNSMALGNGTYTDADNQVIIGNDSITATILRGSIGINTRTPDVFGRSYSGRVLGLTSTGQTALEINSASGSAAYLDMGAAGTRRFGITATSTDTDIGTVGALPLTLSTNGVSRIQISGTGDVTVTRSVILSNTTTGFVEGTEQSSSPAAPAANGWRIYGKDNGSGKTVLYVRFASGAEQQIAIEP